MASGPWILNSEIYPVNVRGIGNSAGITTNWVFNYAISVCFLTLCDTIGKLATFLSLAIMGGIFGTLWLSAFVPETKGLALEEIEELFDLDGPQSSINSVHSSTNDTAATGFNNPLGSGPESWNAHTGGEYGRLGTTE